MRKILENGTPITGFRFDSVAGGLKYNPEMLWCEGVGGVICEYDETDDSYRVYFESKDCYWYYPAELVERRESI
jgi:hypothetical protein